MSAKKVVIITMASLMIIGSTIAGEYEGNRNGKSKGHSRRDNRDGKNPREQIEKHSRHHRKSGIEHIINNPELCEKLGISDEQIERLKDIDTDLKNQRNKLIEEMQNARKEQMKLMKADTLDRKAIMQSINKVGKIRTKLEKLRVKGLFKTQDILTDEQLSTVKERMHKRMREQKNKRKQHKNRKNKRTEAQEKPI